MTSKIFLLLAVLVVTSATEYYSPTPAYHTIPTDGASVDASLSDEDYNDHLQYNFAYDIQDIVTGDTKSQVEARDGNVVRGRYSLIDADGFRRIVDYTADPINGFNAVVKREPLPTVATHSQYDYNPSYTPTTHIIKTSYDSPEYSYVY